MINVASDSPIRVAKPGRFSASLYRKATNKNNQEDNTRSEIDSTTIPTIRTVMYDSNPDDDSDESTLPPKRSDTEIKMEKLGKLSALCVLIISSENLEI